MVDRNLLREFDVADDELQSEIDLALSAHNVPDLTQLFEQTGQVFEVGHIVSGRVVNVVGDSVVVDIGY
jgi:small subunit ribosomal protein S1